MRTLIIDQRTTAIVTDPFYVDGSKAIGIKCSGVSGAEVIAVKVQVGGGLQNVLDSTGTAVTIDSNNKPFTINASGSYVFDKPVTANPVTIQAD